MLKMAVNDFNKRKCADGSGPLASVFSTSQRPIMTRRLGVDAFVNQLRHQERHFTHLLPPRFTHSSLWRARVPSHPLVRGMPRWWMHQHPGCTTSSAA